MTSQEQHNEQEQPPYRVVLTENAKLAKGYVHSRNDIEKIKKILRILDTLPEIGRVYDPDYEVMRLPFEVRVAHAGRYGVYYVVDEGEQTVIVFAIEDQRKNPLNRFYGVYPHEAG